MGVLIVMDKSGDTRLEFDTADTERFQELTGKGFRAVALGKDGSPGTLMRYFDQAVEQSLFIPQLQGG
jgi:hypothetical protein